MKISKTMAAIAVLMLALPALSGESKANAQLEVLPGEPVQRSADGRPYKLFEYRGEKFKVFEPEHKRMAVEGMARIY